MRKFLTILTALCLTLVASISLIGCGGGTDPETPGPETPPPAYSAVGALAWDDIIDRSDLSNVTIKEKNPLYPGKVPVFKIVTQNYCYYNPDGIHPSTITAQTGINEIKAMFDFYTLIPYEDLVFDAENDTYAYSGSITATVTALPHYSDDGVLQYKYTNIVIKLANVGADLYISEIATTRIKQYDTYNVPENITVEYSAFGTTEPGA